MTVCAYYVSIERESEREKLKITFSRPLRASYGKKSPAHIDFNYKFSSELYCTYASCLFSTLYHRRVRRLIKHHVTSTEQIPNRIESNNDVGKYRYINKYELLIF